MQLIQVESTIINLAHVASVEYFAPDEDAINAERTLKIQLAGIAKPIMIYGDLADQTYRAFTSQSLKIRPGGIKARSSLSDLVLVSDDSDPNQADQLFQGKRKIQ